MSEQRPSITIETITDVTRLLGRGDCCVLRFPNSSLAERASASIVRVLSESPGCLVVSLAGSRASDTRTGSTRSLSLEKARSRKEALLSIAREVRKASPRSPVLVSLHQPLPSWLLRPSYLLSFTEALVHRLKLSKHSAFVILTHDIPLQDDTVVLKDRVDFFLDVFQVGNILFGQFLSAKGVYQPGFFFPRRVTVVAGEIRLGAPVIPSATQTPDGTVIGDVVESAYRTVFDTLPEGIVLFDLEGEYREANRKGAEILGYTPEELRRVSLADIVSPLHRVRAYRAFHTLKKKKSVSVELNVKRKSGRTVLVSAACSRLSDGRFAAVVRDVSANRKAEAEEREGQEYLRSMVDNSRYPQVLVMNKRLSSGNAAFRRSFPWVSGDGTTAAAFFGKENTDFVHDITSPAWPAEGALPAYAREVVVRTPDDVSRHYEVSVSHILTGTGKALHLTFMDVTDRIRVLESLEESEKRFRVLIDNSIGAVSVVQEDRFTFVNRAFLELFGYLSSEHVIGQNVAVVLAPRERASVPEKLHFEVRASQAVRQVQLAGVTNDGRHLALEVSVERVHIAGVQSLLCYWRDATPEKKADREIRRRTRELDIAEKVLTALHSSIEPREVMASGLRAALKWLGFDCGGLFVREGGDFNLVIQQDLPEIVATTLARMSATEGFLGYVAKTCESLNLVIPDYPPHVPYRSLFEGQGIQTILQLPVLKGEALQGILLLCSKKLLGEDEHDPALAEVIGRHYGEALFNATQFEAIRTMEDRYHRAVDALEDVVYHAYPNGAMVFVSPQAERLLGHTPDEFVRSPDLWRSLCHPDDRSKYSERISAQTQGAEGHRIEYRILPKGKAVYRWVREVIRYHRNEAGTLSEIRGIVSDITDGVRLQHALSISETYTRAVAEHTEEGIVLYDAGMKCVLWNDALQVLTGIKTEEAIGRSASDVVSGFERDKIATMVQLAAGGETVSEELVFRPSPKNGEKILDARFSPVRDQAGTLIGVAGTVTDRTRVKTLEREARESEDTLRNLIDAMGDALLISDLQGRIWDVNKEFLTLTGYGRSEVLGSTFPYPWLLDEEMSKFVVWIAALREKKFLRDFDMSWRRRDGHTLAISLNTTLLRNAAGEPVAMLNIARDISERKRLTNELASKHRQIEMLNRIISTANSTVEFEDIFERIASEVQALLPFDQISVALLSDDRQSMTMHACISTSAAPLPVGSIVPVYRTVWRIAVQRGEAQVFSSLDSHPDFGPDTISVSQGLKSEITIPITLNDRVLGTFNIGSMKEHAFTGTELTYLQPIADQIGALIDRTQLFQRVSDDGKYIHNLLNSIESVVYTVDPAFRIREVNKAWEEFAVMQGLVHLADEASVLGKRIDEVIVDPNLWNELNGVMPRLFAQNVDVFSRDLEVNNDTSQRVFHLVVSPMVINDRVTGLVFTFTDITDVKKREAEIRRRNRELTALNAISTSISQSLNYDEVLDIASEGTLEMVGGKAVLCYLWNPGGRDPILLRHPGMSAEMASEMCRGKGSIHLARTVIEHRTSLFIGKALSTDSRLSEKERGTFQHLGVRSVACLPLSSKDRARGALLVAFTGEHDFTEQEEKFLELIGNNVATAIENAQLYAEVQEQVRLVTSLYELGKRLTGALDRKTVLEVLSDEIRKSIPFSLFAYDAVIGEQQTLERVFQTGAELAGEGRALPPALFEAVMRGHRGYYESNGEGRWTLGVPVRSENRTTGVLSVIALKPGADGEALLRLLESIANLAGIALDRAALYDTTVAKSIEIEQRNRELDDFTYVVSHDLKEPLITIEGYSKIVLKDYQDHLDEQGKEFLSAVVQSTARMKNLIDDLLTLSRVGRAAESQEPVQVNSVLQDVLRDFEFTLREKNATIVVPPSLPTVTYNPTQLSMVFRNLIGNALKFNDKPEPRIEVAVAEEDHEYRFSVADNGIGIEAQHFEKIFVIFQRLHRTEQYQGTGAGLTIVKKIVENHRGRIWLESTLGSGTTFYFTIPK